MGLTLGAKFSSMDLLRKSIEENSKLLRQYISEPKEELGNGPVPLVAFAGYAGSGKDTAAHALIGYGFRYDTLGEPLYRTLELLNPFLFDGHRVSRLVGRVGWFNAKRHPEVRGLLQRLGEALRITLGEDVLVQVLERRMRDLSLKQYPVVIPDLRSVYEAKWIQHNRGIVIWVERPGVGPVNDHERQVGLLKDLADATVLNDGSKEDLWRRTLEAVEQFKDATR